MIDLTSTKNILADVEGLIDDLHGCELDETDAITSQSKGEARRIRAQRSQDLQYVATRLELAAQLVRVEYWHARGEDDPTRPDRKD